MTEYVHSVKNAELLVVPPRPTLGGRTILSTLPHGKGWIFGVMTVDSRDEMGRERLLHITGSHCEHLAGDMGEETNAPRRFEQMLASLNADLLEAAQELRLKSDKIHGVVGLVTRNQIFLSGIGNISALFLHKTADKRYSVYELDAEFASGRQDGDERYFHTMLDGETHGGDVFYVATRISPHALSTNELHDILVTLPPTGALQRIRQFVPPGDTFAAVSFLFTEDEKTSGPPRKANPIGSLEALQTAKERTATVLGESNAELSHMFKNIGQSLKKSLSAPGTRGFIALMKRGLSLILTLAQAVMTALARVFSNIFLGSSKRKMSLTITPKRAGALVAIGLLLVLGITLFFVTRGRGARAAEEAQFAQTAKSVEDRILAAEASLIYRNTEEARAAVTEAENILETLPKNSGDHTKTINDLAQRLAAIEDNIRGIIPVNPQTLAILSPTSDGGQFTVITEAGGTLYGVTEDLAVYRFDGLTGSFVKEETTNGVIASVRSATPEGSNALVVDLDKQLGRIDFTAHTLNPLTSGTNAMLSVEDIVSYSSNLYALSAGSEQIVKMRPLGTSYEAGTPWIIAKESDLSLARAIAIDGDIYLLTRHDVLKFNAGKEEVWPHAAFDPELTNPVDLWTDTTTAYLYVLDAGAGRVIVLEKETGNLEAQYTADAFKDAIGFSVEESANRIIVVTGTTAYGFTADHLIK